MKHIIPTDSQFIQNCHELKRIKAKRLDVSTAYHSIVDNPENLTPKTKRLKGEFKDSAVALEARQSELMKECEVYRDRLRQYVAEYMVANILNPSVEQSLTTDSILSPMLLQAFRSKHKVLLAPFGNEFLYLSVEAGSNTVHIDVTKAESDERWGHSVLTVRRTSDYEYEVRESFERKLTEDANITLNPNGTAEFTLDGHGKSTQDYTVRVQNMGECNPSEMAYLANLLVALSNVAMHLNANCDVEALNHLVYRVSSECATCPENLSPTQG